MKMQITKTFEIDEKIAPHIKKLNNKGYLTDMCCAGHPEEKEAGYIIFDTITFGKRSFTSKRMDI